MSIYLEEKIWWLFGMDYDVGWIIDWVGFEGVEIGGVMFNVLFKDLVCIGLLMV